MEQTAQPHTELKKNSDMLNGPILATYLHYSIPWASAMILLSSAGLIDGMFVGRYVGPTALAAISLISPMYSLLVGLGIMCAAGGAVCVARYLGTNDLKNASAMLTKSIVALFTISILMALVVVAFATNIIDFMGATGELAQESYTYLVTIALFSPTITCSMGLSYFVRVDGRPRLASLGLMCTAGANIILDYILIVVLDWGILGAAIGTGLAGFIAIIILGAHFFSKKAKLHFVWQIGPWKEVLFAYWNGLSEFVSEASIGLVIFLINLIILREFGENGVAAFTIINYTNWFVLTISYGLSDPLAPLVSINHAAGNGQRSNSFVHTGLVIIMGLGVIAFAVCTFAPELLLSIFLPGDMEVRGILLEFLDLYKWAFLFVGANMAITSTLTGFNLAGKSALLALLRGLILPVLFLLALPSMVGISGVYMAIPIAEGLTFVVAMVLFSRAKCRNLHCNSLVSK